MYDQDLHTYLNQDRGQLGIHSTVTYLELDDAYYYRRLPQRAVDAILIR